MGEVVLFHPLYKWSYGLVDGRKMIFWDDDFRFQHITHSHPWDWVYLPTWMVVFDGKNVAEYTMDALGKFTGK